MEADGRVDDGLSVTTLEFDGGTFARGWCSVALASGDEPSLPALYRAVLIEIYEDDGVMLVATDGYIWLRCWVPAKDTETPPPLLDELPAMSVVATDHHGRGINLLQWVLKESSKVKNDEPVEMTVVLNVGPQPEPGPDEDRPLEGMERQLCTIEVPGHERVELGVHQATWTDWRAFVGRFTGEETKAIALNPTVLERLVKLGKIHGRSLVWTFGGHDRMALIEVRDSEPWVAGAVMPIRLTREELDFAEFQAEAPGDGDLLSGLVEEVAELVNAGALDTDDMKVTVSVAP